MAPKEPTRAQLSSKLSYQQHTPSFLLKLQNRVAGIPDEDEEEEQDPEFEYVGSGRPPIPKRPAIPERPAEDPGSADEDDADEKPQVVVLRKGKHLTEREAENVRRSEKGLPPLPDPQDVVAKLGAAGPSKDSATAKPQLQGLSFSSSSRSKTSTGKRKAVGQPEEEKEGKGNRDKKDSVKKKAKKLSKTLLSFDDEA
ncbi:hypothetical protein K443DRAFT_282933 [Laccaria amethystina LaAM-08-1]|uniref:DUF4604 domain-containing protein n=1 Tax=Laccaria amethystina LaAM-08-1 TaxID=1095629 RepID=A0A0C9WKN0_9AGAR|nr:hypothetical protein K443DRAFT_282933 [Laccaria amethystina LaAM-08-1]